MGPASLIRRWLPRLPIAFIVAVALAPAGSMMVERFGQFASNVGMGVIGVGVVFILRDVYEWWHYTRYLRKIERSEKSYRHRMEKR